MWLKLALLTLLTVTFLMSVQHLTASEPRSLVHFRERATDFGSLLEVPVFETSVEEVDRSLEQAIAKANARLDKIAGIDPEQVTFTNTVRALDDLWFDASQAGNRLALIKETHPKAGMRSAATDAMKRFEEWAVGLDYREDVFRVIKAYADSKPDLAGEDRKLLDETMRDYKRAGLMLPKEERDEVERLRKELTRLSTDFDSNITAVQKELKFTRAELEGVPESFFTRPGVKTGPDEYTVKVNVTWQRLLVLENAKSEDVRRQVKEAAYRLAMKPNVPLIRQIVLLRDRIAQKLAYANWADYRTEVKMVRDAKTAIRFLEDLEEGLQPKFRSELAALQRLKIRDTGNEDAQIRLWDWRYYSNLLKKEQYNVDVEALRVFFPYQQVLDGMFTVYQRIFGLKFERVSPPYKWVEDLQLYAVLDAESGEPMGLFYLDMFPREGKYNHFAQFGLIEGKQLPDGDYQRPVCALICNFPPPQQDKPSLLSHGEVETLFHEFGHAMHTILTRANHVRFSGTSVPRDFVEAPSQMLENWVWDKDVLDSFAADYRDPSRKIPEEILEKLDDARKATIAMFYRRQLSFGQLDLALHAQVNQGGDMDPVELSNRILSEVFLPVPEDSAFIAYFGHLTGYDAGYYGYAWADAIAADMATVFEQAPDRYLDTGIGARLRKEIYEPGDSREAEESIQMFLGRARSLKPFLEEIGITAQ